MRGANISALSSPILMLTLGSLALLAAAGVPAGADPIDLHGGVFVAHVVPELEFSAGTTPPAGWCAAYEPYAIHALGEANTSIAGDSVPAVWYVIAAWEGGEKTWCGTEFGLGAFDPAGFQFIEWGPCFPQEGLEIPTPGWPGPQEGTAFVTTSEPWSGNWVPVYFFAGYAGTGATTQTLIPLAEDPATQFAGFANCLFEREVFRVEAAQRGALGIHLPGETPVFPPVHVAVCCLAGECELLPEADCLAVAGEWWWWLDTCEPNPCPGDPHVCCVNGACGIFEHEEQCTALGGIWHPEWTSCSPNPCPQPTVCCVGTDCVIVYDAQACADLGGAYHPGWMNCAPNPCPAVCCLEDGECLVLGEGACLVQGGEFRPDLGQSCDPNPCPLPQVCCYNGQCIIVHSQQECEQYGGATYHPEWQSCNPNPCPEPLWACCFDTGQCLVLTAPQCQTQGGTVHTEHTCDPNPCPQPAVCCVYGTCHVVYSISECNLYTGGVYHPEWASCDPNPCPVEPYVCCFEDGRCELLLEQACLQSGGVWRPGLGQSCTPNPCPQPRVCCVYNECLLVMTQAACQAMPGGVWHSEWTSCDPNPCPQRTYVCCFEVGTCLLLYESECLLAGGEWHPELGRSCSPNPCSEEARVCCLPGGYCEVLTQTACLQVSGVWRPDLGLSCSPNPCPHSSGPDDLSGGALFVHYVPELVWSYDPPAGGWCAAYEPYAVQGYGDLYTRIDVQSMLPVVWYVLAAWEENDKRACGMEFGLGAFDPSLFGFQVHTPCYPEQGLEISTSGWPGPNEGTAFVTTGIPWEGNWIPAYCFGGYAYGYAGEGVIPIGVDPSTGFVGFSNCEMPPQQFEVGPEQRGALGINMDGYPPTGSTEERVCCLPDGACEIASFWYCESVHGIWHPEWSSCSPNPCPEAAYVCCFEDGGCDVLFETQCAQAGGRWMPELGRSCDPNPCPPPSICCAFGECFIVFSAEECYEQPGGVYYPTWSSCDPNPCPAEAYVCCLPGGICEVLSQPACLQAGGEWHPEMGTSCIPNPCAFAVCCYYGEICVITSQQECLSAYGEWHPEWTSCEPNPCGMPTPNEKTSWGRIKRLFQQ